MGRFTLVALMAIAATNASAQERGSGNPWRNGQVLPSKAEPSVVSRLTISQPADAKLYIADKLVKEGGVSHVFDTPKLVEGRGYEIDVKIEYKDGIETITRQRTVKFKGGDPVVVTFDDRRVPAVAATPAQSPPTKPDTPPARTASDTTAARPATQPPPAVRPPEQPSPADVKAARLRELRKELVGAENELAKAEREDSDRKAWNEKERDRILAQVKDGRQEVKNLRAEGRKAAASVLELSINLAEDSAKGMYFAGVKFTNTAEAERDRVTRLKQEIIDLDR